ncbi:MAG TPA: hypothetical protein VFS56_05420 [Gemmatimonadaceae bacterium]|nr:hypothetical protein [Gemmatimonadaceae bacterium]
MKPGKPSLFACLAAFLVAGCADGSFSNKVSLPLTFVDGQALPVTLPSGTGTVQVVSGTLSGSQLTVECTWVVNLSNGSSPTGTVQECSLFITDTETIALDLGGPPGPSGSHTYQFGFGFD